MAGIRNRDPTKVNIEASNSTQSERWTYPRIPEDLMKSLNFPLEFWDMSIFSLSHRKTRTMSKRLPMTHRSIRSNRHSENPPSLLAMVRRHLGQTYPQCFILSRNRLLPQIRTRHARFLLHGSSLHAPSLSKMAKKSNRQSELVKPATTS